MLFCRLRSPLPFADITECENGFKDCHGNSSCVNEAFIVIVKKDLLEEESTAKVRTTKKKTNLNYIW